MTEKFASGGNLWLPGDTRRRERGLSKGTLIRPIVFLLLAVSSLLIKFYITLEVSSELAIMDAAIKDELTAGAAVIAIEQPDSPTWLRIIAFAASVTATLMALLVYGDLTKMISDVKVRAALIIFSAATLAAALAIVIFSSLLITSTTDFLRVSPLRVAGVTDQVLISKTTEANETTYSFTADYAGEPIYYDLIYKEGSITLTNLEGY